MVVDQRTAIYKNMFENILEYIAKKITNHLKYKETCTLDLSFNINLIYGSNYN